MIKSCFIIMGYHTKTSEDGKEYNLDLSYELIIKPTLKLYNIEGIRADEIMVSEIIDDSMYRLLLLADLVIADITTLNPNAIYELGIRYALKPFSTIIICSDDTRLPFDLNHIRVFMYKHLGVSIEPKECQKVSAYLSTIIDDLMNNKSPMVDSPVYKYLSHLQPPQYTMDDNHFTDVVKRFKSSDSFGNLIQFAYKKRDSGQFEEAISLYEKALKISYDEYVIKEIAVCMYQTDTYDAYKRALSFLKENIQIENTLNPEILKTLGTIYKNLWLLNPDIHEYAKSALSFYEKSFVLLNAYNSGLNYGFMLLATATISSGKEQKTYYYWACNIYEKVLSICNNKYSTDDYWLNASIAECYCALRNESNYEKYMQIAKLNLSDDASWKEQKTKKQIKNINDFLFKLNFLQENS